MQQVHRRKDASAHLPSQHIPQRQRGQWERTLERMPESRSCLNRGYHNPVTKWCTSPVHCCDTPPATDLLPDYLLAQDSIAAVALSLPTHCTQPRCTINYACSTHVAGNHTLPHSNQRRTEPHALPLLTQPASCVPALCFMHLQRRFQGAHRTSVLLALHGLLS
jgi:hypothetical protein